MSNVIRSSFQPVAREIIAKLVKAGYLQPAVHNNAEAITNAISQMKQDLRGRRDRDNGPRDRLSVGHNSAVPNSHW
jgi:hypothetical protein